MKSIANDSGTGESSAGYENGNGPGEGDWEAAQVRPAHWWLTI